MIYIIYAALAVLVLLLLVSTWLASRHNIFKKQIRDKSELAIMLSINAKHESDFTKSMQLMDEAEKLKNEIALIVGKLPAMQRYQVDLPEIPPAEMQAPVDDLSIGQLMNKYDEQGNHKVIYAKFNQER